MSSSKPADESPGLRGSSGALGASARFYWMLGGNAILGFLAVFIAQTRALLSAFDLAYWAVFVSLAAVRYADVAFLHGSTADGAPATPAHWRRYSAMLFLVCLALWAAAHALAFFLGE